MDAMPQSGRRWLWMGGRAVEIWENPEIAFGATTEHMRLYTERGEWVLLFNAMTLAASAMSSDG